MLREPVKALVLILQRCCGLMPPWDCNCCCIEILKHKNIHMETDLMYWCGLFWLAEGCSRKSFEAAPRASWYMDTGGCCSSKFSESEFKVLCSEGKDWLWGVEFAIKGPKVEMHSLKTVDCSKLLHCQTVFGPALAFPLAVWLLMLSIQVLEGVIKYRWNALPVEQRDGIKNYISDLIVQVSFCNICIMPWRKGHLIYCALLV